MRSNFASVSRVLVAVLVLLCAASAQSKVGIYISRGIVTISGVTCGFDCSSATNTVHCTANVNDVLDVRVLGATGFPGYVFLSAGPAFACPGISITGIANAFLLNPAGLVPTAFGLSALPSPARGTCGETGNGIVLQGLVVPPGTSGGVVTFQGIAMDGPAFHFTRPIELAIL